MVQFDFTSAHVNEDGELCLKVINTPAARQFVLGMRERMYTCEVKEYRQKRSLDANAYFHVLCGKIAEVLEISKPRCKNILIGRYGQPELLENGAPAVLKSNIPISFMLEQETLHCMPCGEKEENGVELTFYRVYRGSHTYDTKEMSQLIDWLIDEAKNVGVDVISDADRALLLEDWHEVKKKTV